MMAILWAVGIFCQPGPISIPEIANNAIIMMMGLYFSKVTSFTEIIQAVKLEIHHKVGDKEAI